MSHPSWWSDDMVFPRPIKWYPQIYLAKKSGQLDVLQSVSWDTGKSVYSFLAPVSFSWLPRIFKVRFKLCYNNILQCNGLINTISSVSSVESQVMMFYCTNGWNGFVNQVTKQLQIDTIQVWLVTKKLERDRVLTWKKQTKKTKKRCKMTQETQNEKNNKWLLNKKINNSYSESLRKARK